MEEDERRKLINERTRLQQTCDEWRRRIARLESQGNQDPGYMERQNKIAALHADIGHLEEGIEALNDKLA
jgi:predicted  nucleic acid-binding Zn-ribbon protein